MTFCGLVSEESDPPVTEPLLSSVANPDLEKEDGGISGEVAMTTGEDEDAEEEYRCEMCNTLFHSLMQFMDHRNYDCMAGKRKVFPCLPNILQIPKQ